MRTEIRRDPEALWCVEDVTRYLAVPVESIDKMISERSIPHLSIGEHLRFRRSDIDRWLDLMAVPCQDQALRPQPRSTNTASGSSPGSSSIHTSVSTGSNLSTLASVAFQDGKKVLRRPGPVSSRGTRASLSSGAREAAGGSARFPGHP